MAPTKATLGQAGSGEEKTGHKLGSSYTAYKPPKNPQEVGYNFPIQKGAFRFEELIDAAAAAVNFFLSPLYCFQMRFPLCPPHPPKFVYLSPSSLRGRGTSGWPPGASIAYSLFLLAGRRRTCTPMTPSSPMTEPMMTWAKMHLFHIENPFMKRELERGGDFLCRYNYTSFCFPTWRGRLLALLGSLPALAQLKKESYPFCRASHFFHFVPFNPCLTLSSFFSLQSNYQGINGPPEPGPVSAVQHKTAADPGPIHPASPHPLLPHNSRLWVAGHRRFSHCYTGNICFINALSTNSSTRQQFNGVPGSAQSVQ